MKEVLIFSSVCKKASLLFCFSTNYQLTSVSSALLHFFPLFLLQSKSSSTSSSFKVPLCLTGTVYIHKYPLMQTEKCFEVWLSAVRGIEVSAELVFAGWKIFETAESSLRPQVRRATRTCCFNKHLPSLAVDFSRCVSFLSPISFCLLPNSLCSTKGLC